MKISEKELKRYSKQIILKKIGLHGQKKLMSSKVIIFGIGGLGCPLAIYLANLGVGKIGIVDDDKVELSNLNRQIMFGPKDVGKYKVDIAKNKIKIINNKLKVEKFKVKANQKNILKLIKHFDIVCDGTDNFKSRLLINDSCVKSKKILISAAVSGYEGHIFNFNFKKKVPCFRCFMPNVPVQVKNCETEGVTPTVAGIMGTLQANEVFNTILKLNLKDEKKMVIFNSMSMSFRKVKLSKNKDCTNKC